MKVIGEVRYFDINGCDSIVVLNKWGGTETIKVEMPSNDKIKNSARFSIHYWEDEIYSAQDDAIGKIVWTARARSISEVNQKFLEDLRIH